MTEQTPERTLTRRSVMKGAAWAAPVLAMTAATPAQAASQPDVGRYTLTGSCGLLHLGAVQPGFTLSPGTEPLPIGTQIVLVRSGLLSIGVIETDSGLASVTAGANNRTRVVTLTSPLEPGETLNIRSLLSLTIAFRIDATVTLPQGYTATNPKQTAFVENDLLVSCSAD